MFKGKAFQDGVDADKQKCDPVHRHPGTTCRVAKAQENQINDAKYEDDQPAKRISLAEFHPEVLTQICNDLPHIVRLKDREMDTSQCVKKQLLRQLYITIKLNVYICVRQLNGPQMRAIVTLILTSSWLAFTYASGPVFHKVDVREGDGIYTLLKRYNLGDQVSIDKFCELNNLNIESHLVIGRDYFLPVLVYQYDGKSIRSTIGIDNWDLAVRIAQFNRDLQSRGLRPDSYEESLVLWVPYRELMDSPATLPVKTSTASTIREPLFGPDAERVTILSQKLAGKVFYIVSGHGGPDPGAMAVASGHTLCEDEYAYDVSLRLARNLMEQGAIVEMVVQDPNDGIRSAHYLKCDKDEYTSDKREMPLNQLQRLKQRVELVNSMHKDYLRKGIDDQTVICIHVDSQHPRARTDVYFYYYESSASGKRIADALQETFKSKYSEKRSGRGYSGTVSSRGLYELRNTDPTAVYIELANIQNSADLKRILPESNRQAVANWICDGLMRVKS